MAGGDDQDVAEAHEVLKDVASNYTHMGPAGAGQATKLINHVLCGIGFLAVAEATALAEDSGVDAARIPQALRGGRADSAYFADELAARTDGELTAQVFPSGQLGNDAQMIDGVRSGIIDIALVGLNNLTGLVPEAGAFELPFMFPTRDDAYAALDGAPGQAVAEAFEQHGLKSRGFPRTATAT